MLYCFPKKRESPALSSGDLFPGVGGEFVKVTIRKPASLRSESPSSESRCAGMVFIAWRSASVSSGLMSMPWIFSDHLKAAAADCPIVLVEARQRYRHRVA
jgi:hypothetical protein